NAAAADGERACVRVESRSAHLPLHDWELRPLVLFVDSGHHGIVHIMNDQISLDAAFTNQLLGLRMIQADYLQIGEIPSQDYLTREQNGVIYGEGEKSRLASADEVAGAVRALDPLFDAVHRANARASVLTDADIDVIFAMQGDELAISGVPYYFFW